MLAQLAEDQIGQAGNLNVSSVGVPCENQSRSKLGDWIDQRRNVR